MSRSRKRTKKVIAKSKRIRISIGTFFNKGAIGLIRVYQIIISPWLPTCCRFTPSCSNYAIEAYKVYGFFRGSKLTIWRLLRCQPLCRGGYDPLPLQEEELKGHKVTKKCDKIDHI